MKTWYRAVPVLFASVVLLAAACTPPPTGGGGGNLAPIAVATATPTSGNVPLAVSFDSAGSTDPDGTIVSYAWDFGDTASGTGATTSHTYTAAGSFTAVLTVTDNGGKTATSSVTITVTGDGDGDGFFPPSDCNDADAATFPGAPDEAGDNIDQNCDGIDGEQAAAIFVNASTGANTSTCGTTLEPCASIGQGQTRAIADGKTKVFVAGGTYAKFGVVAGLEVRGGYGQNWQRGVSATTPSVATVQASFDASVGGPVAILANGISTATTVADLKVVGATAGAGQNSYGVHVANSTSALVLDSLEIAGGTAGDGVNGANGSAGWAGSAASGSNGGGGFEPGGVCNLTDAGAGGGGAGGGGNGGRGGVVDSSCTSVFGVVVSCNNCNAQGGLAGGNGSGAGAGFGIGGGGGAAATDGLPGICTIGSGPPVNGSNGAGGANGSAGAAGAGGAPGAAGGSGGLGSNGLPGGGGGGGGANDCNIDDAGAGGGGGGAGGARAAVAGGGGAAGARSAGLWLVSSSPTLVGLDITLGTGGKGGNGGAGAPGQPGGAGGAGGAAFDRGGAGGSGGSGGTGGASGAGGGGGGGAANGVVLQGGSTVNGSVAYSGGTGGAGGSGANNGATGQVVNVATV
jgi:PKD repeat protein